MCNPRPGDGSLVPLYYPLLVSLIPARLNLAHNENYMEYSGNTLLQFGRTPRHCFEKCNHILVNDYQPGRCFVYSLARSVGRSLVRSHNWVQLPKWENCTAMADVLLAPCLIVGSCPKFILSEKKFTQWCQIGDCVSVAIFGSRRHSILFHSIRFVFCCFTSIGSSDRCGPFRGIFRAPHGC